MKKMSKRILSLFLAAVMVFTTVPFTALTALADGDERTTQAYLVDGIDSEFSKTGNVTWDSTEKAAYFDGSSYLTLPSNPLANVTNSSGFAISFDVKRIETGNSMSRILDLNGGNDTNTFAINGGSDTNNNYEKYLTLAKVNGTECRYYANDFANTAYCDNNSPSFCTEEQANTWYNITVYMDADGYYWYAIDGVIRARFLNNYNTQGVSNGVTATQIKNSIAGMTQLLVGRAIYNDPYFKGYIKNLYFFDFSNTEMAALTAMDWYENKMANGIYTNMVAAYDAYCDASAKYDSKHYGNASPDLASASKALFENVATMSVLSVAKSSTTIKGTKTSAYDSSYSTSSLVAGDTMSNVLWTYGVGSNSSYTTGTKVGREKAGVQYGYIVFLYNGGAMECPVNLFYYRDNLTGTGRLRSMRPTTANFTMTKAYWHGESTSTGYQTGTTDRASITDNEETTLQNSRDTYYNTNTLKYTGTGSGSTVYNVNVAWRWYDNNGSQGNFTTSNASIIVVDYVRLLTAFETYRATATAKGYFENVANYREGGLRTYLNALNSQIVEPNGYFNSVTSNSAAETAATNLNNAISTAVSNLTGSGTAVSSVTPAADSNWVTLRNAFDTKQTTKNNKQHNAWTAKATNGAGFSDETYGVGSYATTSGTFIKEYNDAVALFAACVNTTNGGYASTNVTSDATALVTAIQNLDRSAAVAPTVAVKDYVVAGETIAVTNVDAEADGNIYYKVSYDGGAYSAEQSIAYSSNVANINFFSGNTDKSTAAVKVYVKVNGVASEEVEHTFTLFKAPTVSKTIVNLNETVELTSQNGSQSGAISYSLDGSAPSIAYSAPFAPFSGTSSDTDETLKVKETRNFSDHGGYTCTATANYPLSRSADFIIRAKYSNGGVHSKGDNYYDSESKFYIENADTYNSTVTYTLYIDGTLDNSYTYDKVNGIAMTSAIQNASFIKIVAFATDRQNNTIQTEKLLFNVANFSPMIFRESFNTEGDDGVKVENMHLYKKDGTAYNLYATPAGTIALEKGAGTKTDSGTEAHSWRNNVLKINANATAPGPVVTFENNPLSESYSTINASAARSEGVTIAFWRHLEDGSGNTVSLPASGDATGYPWRNAIAFQKKNDNTAYYIIEVNGVNSRRIDGSHYQDVVPENQDKTEHEEGNNNGEWEHVAITINPNTGIHVYTNGVEHDYKYVKINAGSGESSKTDIKSYAVGAETTANAAEIINFLTASDTEFTLDNGVMYEGNEYNLFLDDIRIYAQSLSQVDINNMYTDEYADVQTNVTSTSHDPSTVTVYTLGEAVTTDNGTKAAGSKVGQEFIDYYAVPESKISQIEYYSFGTGMTIYKAGGTEKTITGDMQIQWNVLGDSEGRCGYQNQDLFGTEYHTALAEVATYVQGTGAGPGAGHLVWAPHVMYNLTLDKWVYYAAMSSWGKNRSATFYATSANPISGYAYQGMIYKSSSYHPNAIDSCVYYGYDNNTGKPIKSDLYMVIGSWGHVHRDGRYDAIYGTQINANGSAPAALSNNIDALEEPGTPNSLGVNSYALVRGYTGDLEGTNYGSGGSGEGAYVQYINGYYYLFVSYGQNEGSYTERVFRATTPLGTDKTNAHINTYTEYTGTNGFQANDDRLKSVLDDDDALINYVRGNQILAPFDNSIYTKTYRSTGHNSVYKARNNDGDWVYVNAVHARPYASKSHNWTAVQDNALAKRQSGGVTGNVCFNNMLAVTEHGWLVMYPYQYNGNDSVYKEVKASKLEGLYYGNNMRQIVNSDWGSEYQYTILANPDDETDTTGIIFGVRDDTDFRMKFKLVRDASGDKVQYIRVYSDSATFAQILADSVSPIHEGVIGIHNKSGESVPMLATLNVDDSSAEYGLQFWAYRMGNIPDVDKVISHGDLVSMDGVIYTHASDKEVLVTYGVTNGTDAQKELALKSGYALYGQEISNNWNYGQKDANDQYTSGGERYTTLTTKFPASVDMDKAGNIISLNDNDYCRYYGESGSNMRFVELNGGKWCTKNADGSFTQTAYTDEEAAAAVEANPSLELYKVYGIEGKVSSFFRYYNNTNDGIGVRRNGYPKVGVTLVVSYVDVTDGTKYSEFEFCYVMPNPAWAHTIAATKNAQSDTIGNDRSSSYGLFNRFENSYGEASDYSSALLYYAARGEEQGAGWGYGTSGYLTDFATHNFTDTDLDTLEEIETLMNNSPSKAAGVNSGSFSAGIHKDVSPNAYIATPQVINTQYYVDYSDKSNYIKNNPNTGLITTGSNNTSDVPTGYQFKMKTSNFLWANYSGSSILNVSSYAMNNTGLNVTYSSTTAGTQPYNKTTGDGDYHSGFTNASVYDTNYQEVKAGNSIGVLTGKTAFKEDGFLFHTDERNSSDARFSTDYRNKLLYYFSSGTNHSLMYPVKDTVNNSNNYFDGTSKNGTPGQIYDFRSNQAYTTASNGKLSTNAWQGTATFTGKNSLRQNTLSDLETIGNNSSSDTLEYSNGRLYDGWYYYTNEYNDVKREHWTTTADDASSKTVTSYGRVDVTAENLANYILEMGNYHKVTDLGVDGGRFVAHETYHYYNIGVATCDKGAARDFLETYGLKHLAYTEDPVTHKKTVIRDANTGRPTANGDMNVEDISAASYRDYINAIAKLSWFVKNPQNTLQNDLKGETTYDDVDAIQNATAAEYTTAYSNGTALYYQDKTGANIFTDGTTNTDAVQAQLIDDVITAYENLYTVEDYKRVEQEYKATKDAIDAAIEAASGDYTDESIANYTKDFEAIKLAVEYYTDITGVNKDEDIDSTLLDFDDDEYWRYSNYSGADYEKLRDAMKDIQKSLMPKVDTSVLSSTANTQAGVVRQGIFENGVQTKRIDQWSELFNAVCDADGSQFDSGDGTVQTEHPKAMFDTTGGVTKSLNEILDVKRVENDPSTHLDYVLYPTVSSVEAAHAATYYDNTAPSADVYVGVDFDKDGTVDEYAKISEVQKNVNKENYELSDMTVDLVDDQDAYVAYNSAYNIVANSVNREKYTNAGKEILDNALATKYNKVNNLNCVYFAATQSDVDDYAAITGAAAPFAVGTDLKATGQGETDSITAYLLTQSNLLETKVGNEYPYIRQFTVNFDVTGGSQNYETQTETAYYGDLVEFTIPEEARNNATFSIQYYDDEGNALPATKATYNGETIQRVAKSNMDITVKVSNKAQAEGYKVQIKNIYGTVTEVIYSTTLPDTLNSATLTFSGDTVTAPEVPFYTFSVWNKSVNETDRTATYTATYNAGDTLTFDFEGIENANVTGAAATAEGATTYTTAFDTEVTIDASEVENFYAWATEINVGGVTKYQIASYKKKYSFYAVTGEKFIPVLRTGTESNYTYTVNNEELTAAKVDSVYYIDADPSILNSDAILKQKLDAKAPFISTISAKMNSDNNAATGYCRVAYDVNALPSEIGVLARSKATTAEQMESVMALGTAAKFKTANVLETGQFIYTITKTSVFANPVLFRGYIYYDFTYKFGGTNTSGNQTEANLNIGETSGYIATTATA